MQFGCELYIHVEFYKICHLTHLQNLMLHVLDLTPDSAVPLVWIERQEVDSMMRPTQEWNKNVSCIAVTNDSYGRILAHDCRGVFVVRTWDDDLALVGSINRRKDQSMEGLFRFQPSLLVEDNFYGVKLQRDVNLSRLSPFGSHRIKIEDRSEP